MNKNQKKSRNCKLTLVEVLSSKEIKEQDFKNWTKFASEILRMNQKFTGKSLRGDRT